MIEFEVELTNGKAYVYAEWWSDQSGVCYFWIGNAIVKSFGNALSVKAAQHGGQLTALGRAKNNVVAENCKLFGGCANKKKQQNWSKISPSTRR